MHLFHEFPKWKYHAEKEAVIVESKEAEEALGDEWASSPAVFFSKAEPVRATETVVETPKKLLRKAKA